MVTRVDKFLGGLGIDATDKFEVASNATVTIGNGTSTGNVTLGGNIVVGGTVDGRDVATDGAKLDGIESGAKADQTAAEILTLIKTVDGAGSGLDADTVDGISSASFLRSDADDTATGQITFPGAIASRPILPNGFISAATGDADADIWGISEDYYPSHGTAGNAWGIKWASTPNQVQFVGGGTNRLVVDLDGGSTGLTWEGNAVWHAGNDGAGSGLDADLLDGISSGSFLRSDADDSFSGVLTGSSNVIIQSTDATARMVQVGKSSDGSQGTGAIEVTQDGAHGGGISYNGDGSPLFVSGETADNITFYRLNAGARSEVFHYAYNSDTVNFNGNITLAGTVDGRDVASDGTKLDGIESGATADQTASEILTAIKTVDGAGSGLDADLWDGNQFASYLNQAVLTSSTPSFTGLSVTDTISGYVSGAKFSNDSETKDDITTRTESGFFQTSTGTTGEGWPITDNGWQHLIAVTHSNDANYYSMQIAGSFNDNVFYGRKTSGSGSTSWVKFWTDGNDGSGSGLDADTLDGKHANDSSILNPTGSIIMYGAASAPSGYYLCEGAAISRTTYSALFAIIGTTYGAGDGSTTFNVPDFRDRAPYGASTFTLGSKTAGEVNSSGQNSTGTGTSGSSGASTVANNTGTGTTGTGTTGTSTSGGTAPSIPASTYNTGTSTSGSSGASTVASNSGASSPSIPASTYNTGNAGATTVSTNSGSGGAHGHTVNTNNTNSTTDKDVTNAIAVVTGVATVGGHTHTIPSLTVNAHAHSIPAMTVNSHTHSIPSLTVNGHTHSVPALSIPAMTVNSHTHSVPGLSIPGLSVPALSIPSLTVNGHTHSVPALTVTHPGVAVKFIIKT